MRFKIKFRGSDNVFDKNCLPQVKGWFEDTLMGRKNAKHDEPSDYCLSPMFGGIKSNGTETFPDGGYVYITSDNQGLMGFFSLTLLTMASGSAVGSLFYDSFEIIDDFHVHSDYDIVRALSPILLRKEKKTVTFKDENFIPTLHASCVRKLVRNGIPEKAANSLSFELFHPEKAQIVDMQYNSIHNFASKVMLIVKGDKKARTKLYNLGLGSSTGCGFGTISLNN